VRRDTTFRIIPLVVLLAGCSAQSDGDAPENDGSDTSIDQPQAETIDTDDGAERPDIVEGEFPYADCREDLFPQAVRTLIQTKLDEFPAVPGAVVAFYHPDIGNVIAAFGVGDTATDAPMEVGAIFDVGSVHKVLKWIMLEQLFESELLTYDQPLTDFLDRPDIPAATILNLMNHSTGMVDIGWTFIGDVISNYQNGTLPDEYGYDDMMDFLESEDSEGVTNGLVDGFILGEQHNYSSYGPLIAGNIAEEVVDGTSLEYVRTHIVRALNLRDTTFIGFDPTPPVVVQGYGPDECCADLEHPPPPDEVLRAVASGHEGPVFSTACDMLNFTRAIGEPEIGFLTRETIESRTEDLIDVAGVFKVGRGLFSHHGFGSGDFWGHAGDGMHGHSSYTAYNPRNGVSMTVLTNLRPEYIEMDYGVHWQIAGILDTQYD